MATAHVNGIELYYEVHGPEDGDVIILSNGVMMSTASWAVQRDVISKYYRLVLYDCRGMWKSEHPEGPYSMAMHAEDLLGLMDHLEIEKAHIAGISYGSEVSMTFAANYPERTKTLIVIDGVPYVDPFLKAQTLPWLRAAERNDHQLLLDTSVHFNFSADVLEKNYALFSDAERIKRLDLNSFAELMKAFYNFDIRDQLKTIKVPSLVVVGELDLIKTPKHAKYIYGELPNAEFLVIPGSGHASCVDRPHELNTAILGFVGKHAS